MQASKVIRRSICMLKFVPKTQLVKPSCVGVLQSKQCRWRSKWEKLKAKFPPRVPTFDYSGDNDLNLPVELEEGENVFTKIGISQSEIDAAADHSLLSIQNADGREQMDLLIKKTIEKFGRDPNDTESYEVLVACLTVRARNLIKHVQRFPKDKRNKARLIEMIQKRRAHLKDLLAYDVNRFNWVCKELNITYIPFSEYNQYIPRKSRVRTAAIQEMIDMKESKLNELKESLAKEREEYYAKKSEVMKVIGQQQEELLRETEALQSSQVDTGYPGNSGSIAYNLAHIKIVDKEKWWRKHPEVIRRKYAGKPWKGYK